MSSLTTQESHTISSRGPVRKPINWESLAVHVVLIAGATVMLFPFIWQFLTSFKTTSESLSVPATLFPSEWRLDNYISATTLIPFFDQLLVSTISVLSRTAVVLILCSAAGYAFARLRFPGRNILFFALLGIMMVPRELYLLPQTEILGSLGLLNTVTGLVLPGFISAFGVFLMRQFFLSLPASLEEAARIDGAGPFRIFFAIMLPLAKPGLIALAIFTSIYSWNELLWPLIVNSDPEKLNLAAGLSTFGGEFITPYPLLMAGSFLAQLPLIVLFLFMQKQFIEGIAFSGAKS
ncbi:sugar ABC transporter permease [Pseudarthrobacter sp. AB1]|nr:sugar ABC transporter permease [Pseudarthrobacter sp. AB1]QNE15314.1 carbohydrate ABC transporter permease [Pseudarthrobacter sp. NBSH8]